MVGPGPNFSKRFNGLKVKRFSDCRVIKIRRISQFVTTVFQFQLNFTLPGTYMYADFLKWGSANNVVIGT